ncbi:MAG: TetR/AcrR family transcriptional regulator [Anaerolineae bacterium]|nr:TetR/AcrR family transcriptional regulator [Anaerolineae bacterium]
MTTEDKREVDNRSNILACALERFAARGYDAVGVQEIVEAAGITKPTLYHYFGSKLGLLEVLLAGHFAGLEAALAPVVVYKGDLPYTLERVAAAYFQYAAAQRLFYRFQLALWFAPPNSEAFRAVSPFHKKQQQLLETLFMDAARDHGNMRGRHRAYAATYLGMLNTYIGLALNEYTELNDVLVYRAVHQFMHGIFS